MIHQSGVRINPLAHSALPDTEANVIRNLMERIDQLESQSRQPTDLPQVSHGKVDQSTKWKLGRHKT